MDQTHKIIGQNPSVESLKEAIKGINQEIEQLPVLKDEFFPHFPRVTLYRLLNSTSPLFISAGLFVFASLSILDGSNFESVNDFFLGPTIAVGIGITAKFGAVALKRYEKSEYKKNIQSLVQERDDLADQLENNYSIIYIP